MSGAIESSILSWRAQYWKQGSLIHYTTILKSAIWSSNANRCYGAKLLEYRRDRDFMSFTRHYQYLTLLEGEKKLGAY